VTGSTSVPSAQAFSRRPGQNFEAEAFLAFRATSATKRMIRVSAAGTADRKTPK